MSRGKFIVIEGPDCSGKGTVVSSIKDKLTKDNIERFVFTREPGGMKSMLCEEIRSMLLNPSLDMSPETEAMLFATSRMHHVDLIEKELQAGRNVICERYIYSSLVYQGIARGLGQDTIKDMNKYAEAKLKPDLVVFLDISVDTYLERINLRGNKDRIEKEGLSFFKKVIEGYRSLQLSDSIDNKLIVDASRTKPEKIAEQILDEISKKV